MDFSPRTILIGVVLALFICTGIWVHRHGRPRSLLNSATLGSPSNNLSDDIDNDTTEDDVFDESDPDYNVACDGNVRGGFLALAKSWDTFLTAHPGIEKNPSQLEERRKKYGLPLQVWMSDLEENESVDPNSSGTNVLERPHACGTTQIQFSKRWPDGQENFELENEERSPFPTEFAAEVKDGKLSRLWPLGVDDIPIGVQGPELLVQTHLQILCGNCKTKKCARPIVIYAVKPDGTYHIFTGNNDSLSGNKSVGENKTMTCAPVEDLKSMQYDSCREMKDQTSGAPRQIVYQSPCL